MKRQKSKVGQIYISQLILIIQSIIVIYFLRLAYQIQQYYLSFTIKWIIFIIDLSIAFSIIVSYQFQGGIFLFYLLRILFLWQSQQYEILDVLLPTLLWYFIFKIGCYLIIKLRKIKIIDHRNIDERQKLIKNEQQRRNICYIYFAIITLIIISIQLSKASNSYGGIILFIISMIWFVFDIYLIINSQQIFSKLISNSLAYKVYLYIIMTVIYWIIYKQQIFITSLFIYLILLFIMIRIFIGSQSSKFHNIDTMLFDAIYIFKGDQNYRYYHANSGNRYLKLLDKISRQIMVFIYFLSFYKAIYEHRYIWLIISVYTMYSFQSYDQFKIDLLSFIQSKFNKSINLRYKISIPILLLIKQLLKPQSNQKDIIYNQINRCQIINYFQIGFLSSIFIFIFSTKFLEYGLKSKIFVIIEVIAPLIIPCWIIWLECVNLRQVLLGIYVIIYCIQMIRDERNSRIKGNKKD